MKPPRIVIQRETFFVFGCDGVYVVDAEQAQVSKLVKANTTVVVGDDPSVLCRCVNCNVKTIKFREIE